MDSSDSSANGRNIVSPTYFPQSITAAAERGQRIILDDSSILNFVGYMKDAMQGKSRYCDVTTFEKRDERLDAYRESLKAGFSTAIEHKVARIPAPLAREMDALFRHIGTPDDKNFDMMTPLAVTNHYRVTGRLVRDYVHRARQNNFVVDGAYKSIDGISDADASIVMQAVQFGNQDVDSVIYTEDRALVRELTKRIPGCESKPLVASLDFSLEPKKAVDVLQHWDTLYEQRKGRKFEAPPKNRQL